MYWENSVETFGGIIFVLDSVEGDCKCVCVCVSVYVCLLYH